MTDAKHNSGKQAGFLTATLVQFDKAMDHGITPDRLGDGLDRGIAEFWERLCDAANAFHPRLQMGDGRCRENKKQYAKRAEILNFEVRESQGYLRALNTRHGRVMALSVLNVSGQNALLFLYGKRVSFRQRPFCRCAGA